MCWRIDFISENFALYCWPMSKGNFVSNAIDTICFCINYDLQRINNNELNNRLVNEFLFPFCSHRLWNSRWNSFLSKAIVTSAFYYYHDVDVNNNKNLLMYVTIIENHHHTIFVIISCIMDYCLIKSDRILVFSVRK